MPPGVHLFTTAELVIAGLVVLLILIVSRIGK